MNFIARAVHAGREVYLTLTNNTWHLTEKRESAYWFLDQLLAGAVLATNYGFDIPAEKWKLHDKGGYVMKHGLLDIPKRPSNGTSYAIKKKRSVIANLTPKPKRTRRLKEPDELEEREKRIKPIRAFLTHPDIKPMISMCGIEKLAGMKQNALRHHLFPNRGKHLAPPTLDTIEELEKILARLGFNPKNQEHEF